MTKALKSRHFSRSRQIMAFLLLALLAGCMATGRSGPDLLSFPEPVNVENARLNCFLVLQDVDGPDIRLEVESIEVLGDGLWLPVSSKNLSFGSADLGDGQLFLGATALLPGQYPKLRLKIIKGSVREPDGKYFDSVSEPYYLEMTLPEPLQLDRGDSVTVLVSWDVASSLQTDGALRPVFTAASQSRQLLADLIFATCPDIDTVFIVRADKNWVVESFGLRGGPTSFAFEPGPSPKRLYVLASRERVVKVVDLSSHRVLDFFTIPLNDAPTSMTISPDGQSAYLLDERGGYLQRMDLVSGRSTARVRLGFRPTQAIYMEEQNLLAVSLALSQSVVLLDPVTLATRGAYSTGSKPDGLLVANDRLFVAESGDDNVLAIDLARSASQDRLMVGGGPRRLIETDNWIYVSNYASGTLSVIEPRQLGVSREVPGLGRPNEMAFDLLFRRLFVTDEETDALTVVDVNVNRLLGRIVLGAQPFDLDVIQ